MSIFKLKLKILLFINQLIFPCRMQRKPPERPTELCYLCITKGGWLRCRRSRELAGTIEEKGRATPVLLSSEKGVLMRLSMGKIRDRAYFRAARQRAIDRRLRVPGDRLRGIFTGELAKNHVTSILPAVRRRRRKKTDTDLPPAA